MTDIRITKNDIITKLRELGLKCGDNIIAHSSLSSFGYVEGGADTVIDALTELLTDNGTLVMPSFNHGSVYYGESRTGDTGIFDVKTTPTSNGVIADTFWRRPGVLRSMNPTHSFAAWGKNAARYTARHHLVDSFGKDSPVGMLWQDGGQCLFLGVGYSANTFHHFVETHTDAPCISKRGEAYPVRFADGREETIHTWGWRERDCPITDSARYAGLMADYHRQINIGAAAVTLYPLRVGYQIISKCLSEGIDGFPPCSACSNRPRKTVWTIPV